ncbi:tetratricopeptide repeat protein [Aliterella atlantica]|uniref:Tetratricopeptide repeat protein n=1 Tax=Aliterella atlantica CENA595 TaxID=1618023 RepID=A0A0D8ZTN8_9CYAN|nr:tetratricopeptide repeat protein [Aliterella atlantica]KJH71824.1 tetratricopeptide repeat protein [Aliterella atlantica CENA595]
MQVAIINILIAAIVSISLKPAFAATSASDYRSLGLSHRAAGRYDEAIAALKKSVQLEPQNSSGRVLLGWTQHLAGQEEAAAQSLLQVIYRDPQSVLALNALGIVYLVSGYLPESVTVHTWAAILEPKNEIPYYNLSLSLHRLQLYGLAIASAKKAAILEPSNPHPLVAEAMNYWSMGDRTAAKLAYRKALNLDPLYSDSSFLAHLQQAAFTQEQIVLTKQVLSITN